MTREELEKVRAWVDAKTMAEFPWAWKLRETMDAILTGMDAAIVRPPLSAISLESRQHQGSAYQRVVSASQRDNAKLHPAAVPVLRKLHIHSTALLPSAAPPTRPNSNMIPS